MNNIGGNRKIKQISTKTVLEIAKLFIDNSTKVTPIIMSVARRVKSLPFVTEVR
jgi:hypothetical protein